MLIKVHDGRHTVAVALGCGSLREREGLRHSQGQLLSPWDLSTGGGCCEMPPCPAPWTRAHSQLTACACWGVTACIWDRESNTDR